MKKNHLIFIAKKLLELIYIIKRNSLIVLLIRKPFNTWILPRFYNFDKVLKDAEIWKNQDYYSAEKYEDVLSPTQKMYLEYIEQKIDRKDSVFDICCNQGRHLRALHRKGFKNLTGVDIMCDAINIFKESKEYSEGGIVAECSLAQSFIQNAESSSFDYAITFSATIELIHPGFDIFKELYRIVNKGFIFIINENGHSYPRFYRYQINSRGFVIRNCERFSKDLTLLDCIKI